jgi:DNA-binding MarR family transcriptional regulator
MKKTSLTTYEALILQQVQQYGIEDLQNLAAELTIERGKLLRIVQHLRQKGLVLIRANTADTLVELSNKGQRLVRTLWPVISAQAA